MAVKWYGDEVLKAMQREMARRVERATEMVAADMRASIDKPGTSLPGEPPRRDTGELLESIGTSVDVDKHSVTGTITVSAPYAADLELGVTGVRDGKVVDMAPRPFVRPAVVRNLAGVERILKE